VRAKTEEVLKHAKLYAKEAHGVENISPEYEKKIKVKYQICNCILSKN
jgi:predicted small metal-binding protein